MALIEKWPTFRLAFASRKLLTTDEKWFKVKEVFDHKSVTDLTLSKIDLNWKKNELEIIGKLWEIINNHKIISYFSIPSKSIDEVLDIFVRVNSAGTVLSKTDLIFSTLTAKWPQGREAIDTLLKNINKTTRKFSFTNDFIMRTLLYVNDLSVNLKVESFKDSVSLIQKNFPATAEAIKAMVDLLEEYGFSDENITSYNALFPIIYFIYKKGNLKNSKNELIKYFIIAQLKNIFISSSNSVLMEIRKTLVVDTKSYVLIDRNFSVTQLKSIKLSGDRNFMFDDEEIDKLFEYSKGKYTFMILSLLYPEIKVDEIEFHQDHMHPANDFKQKKLKEHGFNEEEIKDLVIMKDQLANLQLLKGKVNESKNKTPLEKWALQFDFKDKYLPADTSLKLSNFLVFYRIRKELMKDALKDILVKVI